MNIKRTCVVVVLILLVAGLAACTRSLTPSDKATQTSPEDVASEEVTPAAGTEVMGQLFLLATQTAMARLGISVEELPEVSTEGAPTEVAPDTNETATVEGQVQDTTTAPTPKPTKVAVPSATPGKPDTYTLQKGEFPFCIARRFDVNPHEMLRVSGIVPNTTLQPGTELKSNIPWKSHLARASHYLYGQIWGHNLFYSLFVWRCGSGRYRLCEWFAAAI